MSDGVAGDEVMDGIVEAGPSVMAVPTSVTAPGVQCSATVWPPAGTKERARSGVPLSSPVSSAKVATGRSSGTLTSATSDDLSVATTEAGSSLPAAPTMSMRRRPLSRSAVVVTSPPSATATPTSTTVPWVVVACSSTTECPVATAAAGSAFCTPANVVSGPVAAVSCGAESSGWSEAGESSTRPRPPPP